MSFHAEYRAAETRSAHKARQVCTTASKLLDADDGTLEERPIQELLVTLAKFRKGLTGDSAFFIGLLLVGCYIAGIYLVGVGVYNEVFATAEAARSEWANWLQLMAGGLFLAIAAGTSEDRAALHSSINKLQWMLSPLAGDPRACKEALDIVKSTPRAAQLRDMVVGRGEELRRFHLARMRSFKREAESEAAKHAQRAVCHELHGLPGELQSN